MEKRHTVQFSIVGTLRLYDRDLDLVFCGFEMMFSETKLVTRVYQTQSHHASYVYMCKFLQSDENIK